MYSEKMKEKDFSKGKQYWPLFLGKVSLPSGVLSGISAETSLVKPEGHKERKLFSDQGQYIWAEHHFSTSSGYDYKLFFTHPIPLKHEQCHSQ